MEAEMQAAMTIFNECARHDNPEIVGLKVLPKDEFELVTPEEYAVRTAIASFPQPVQVKCFEFFDFLSASGHAQPVISAIRAAQFNCIAKQRWPMKDAQKLRPSGSTTGVSKASIYSLIHGFAQNCNGFVRQDVPGGVMWTSGDVQHFQARSGAGLSPASELYYLEKWALDVCPPLEALGVLSFVLDIPSSVVSYFDIKPSLLNGVVNGLSLVVKAVGPPTPMITRLLAFQRVYPIAGTRLTENTSKNAAACWAEFANRHKDIFTKIKLVLAESEVIALKHLTDLHAMVGRDLVGSNSAEVKSSMVFDMMLKATSISDMNRGIRAKNGPRDACTKRYMEVVPNGQMSTALKTALVIPYIQNMAGVKKIVIAGIAQGHFLPPILTAFGSQVDYTLVDIDAEKIVNKDVVLRDYTYNYVKDNVLNHLTDDYQIGVFDVAVPHVLRSSTATQTVLAKWGRFNENAQTQLAILASIPRRKVTVAKLFLPATTETIVNGKAVNIKPEHIVGMLTKFSATYDIKLIRGTRLHQTEAWVVAAKRDAPLEGAEADGVRNAVMRAFALWAGHIIMAEVARMCFFQNGLTDRGRVEELKKETMLRLAQNYSMCRHVLPIARLFDVNTKKVQPKTETPDDLDVDEFMLTYN